jgi:hypothetical protein
MMSASSTLRLAALLAVATAAQAMAAVPASRALSASKLSAPRPLGLVASHADVRARASKRFLMVGRPEDEPDEAFISTWEKKSDAEKSASPTPLPPRARPARGAQPLPQANHACSARAPLPASPVKSPAVLIGLGAIILPFIVGILVLATGGFGNN